MGQSQNTNQRSVCVLERRKRTQRISGFAHSAEARSVEAVSDVPPAAISFLSQEKRYGRKECLGAVGASCGCVLDGHRVFSRYEHT